ncbi:MAG: NmrA family NAD(P)-binding protein [Actinobacteria bacterium]|nr:NmrA family NAD(P)-binding protein [Actinomycetota bacterium]
MQAAGVEPHPLQAGGADLVQRGGSPASVDQAGNANLIRAAARTGASFVLVSVVGASPVHPVGLFRAKYAAEETLRASGIPWTIVRATAYTETWAAIMARPRQDSGKIIVFGRGDNPVNFVSVTDVAALTALAVADPGLRGRVLELGGPDNLTANQFAAILAETAGRRGTVRHIPRPALLAMAWLAAAVKPALARQARAALAMDTLDMTLRPRPDPAGISQAARDRHPLSSQRRTGLNAHTARQLRGRLKAAGGAAGVRGCR